MSHQLAVFFSKASQNFSYSHVLSHPNFVPYIYAVQLFFTFLHLNNLYVCMYVWIFRTVNYALTYTFSFKKPSETTCIFKEIWLLPSLPSSSAVNTKYLLSIQFMYVMLLYCRLYQHVVSTASSRNPRLQTYSHWRMNRGQKAKVEDVDVQWNTRHGESFTGHADTTAVYLFNSISLHTLSTCCNAVHTCGV